MNKRIIFTLLAVIAVASDGWYYFSVVKTEKPVPAPVVQEKPKPAVVPKQEEIIVPFTEGKISLKENSSSKLGDLVFSVLKIHDSRCPVGVQCVWAGELKADILAEFGGQVGTTTIIAGKEPVSLIGLIVEASSSEQVAPGTQPLKMSFSIKKY